MEAFLEGDLVDDGHMHWQQPRVGGLDLVGSSGGTGGGGHNTNNEGCPTGLRGRGDGAIMISAKKVAIADGGLIDAGGEGGPPKTEMTRRNPTAAVGTVTRRPAAAADREASFRSLPAATSPQSL